MEFKLVYQGKLKSNGDAREKHRIREIFHQQLKNLWNYPPLEEEKQWITLPSDHQHKEPSIKQVDGHYFANLICKSKGMFCELDFLILKPDRPISAFGDIDNKLKTILDALRYPNVPQEIPADWLQEGSQNPLICLLEDDELVTKINVNVDKLLHSNQPGEVIMIITVKVKGNLSRMENLGIIL